MIPDNTIKPSNSNNESFIPSNNYSICIHPKYKLDKIEIENLIAQLPTPFILMGTSMLTAKCEDAKISTKL